MPPGYGPLAPDGAARCAAIRLLASDTLLANGSALLILEDADLRPFGGQGIRIQRLRIANERIHANGPILQPDLTVLVMMLGAERAVLFSENSRLALAHRLANAGHSGLAPERCILLDRLAADRGRPTPDLAAFGNVPLPLPPGTNPAQAASAAVRRGLARLKILPSGS